MSAHSRVAVHRLDEMVGWRSINGIIDGAVGRRSDEKTGRYIDCAMRTNAFVFGISYQTITHVF